VIEELIDCIGWYLVVLRVVCEVGGVEASLFFEDTLGTLGTFRFVAGVDEVVVVEEKGGRRRVL